MNKWTVGNYSQTIFDKKGEDEEISSDTQDWNVKTLVFPTRERMEEHKELVFNGCLAFVENEGKLFGFKSDEGWLEIKTNLDEVEYNYQKDIVESVVKRWEGLEGR